MTSRNQDTQSWQETILQAWAYVCRHRCARETVASRSFASVKDVISHLRQMANDRPDSRLQVLITGILESAKTGFLFVCKYSEKTVIESRRLSMKMLVFQGHSIWSEMPSMQLITLSNNFFYQLDH